MRVHKKELPALTDEQAALVAPYVNYAYKVAMSKVGHSLTDDEKSCVHCALYEVALRHRSLGPEATPKKRETALRTHIIFIVKRRLQDFFRERIQTRQLKMHQLDQDFGYEAKNETESNEVFETLLCLCPSREADILRSYYSGNETLVEIAQRLNRTPNNVYSEKLRALKLLHEKLESVPLEKRFYLERKIHACDTPSHAKHY